MRIRHVLVLLTIPALVGTPLACSGDTSGSERGGAGGATPGNGGAAGAEGAECDCNDGFSCTIDRCVDGGCVHSIGPNNGTTACPAGEYCTLARGCITAPACSSVAQCEDTWADDACKTNIACEAASALCTFETLDGDGDGHPPPVCGGGDCDDSDSSVNPGATEQCDGVDDDCDGDVDEGADAGCGNLEHCVEGYCACRPENECDGDCVNKQTSDSHCGECGNACPVDSECVEGSCVCESGATSCVTSHTGGTGGNAQTGGEGGSEAGAENGEGGALSAMGGAPGTGGVPRACVLAGFTGCTGSGDCCVGASCLDGTCCYASSLYDCTEDSECCSGSCVEHICQDSGGAAGAAGAGGVETGGVQSTGGVDATGGAVATGGRPMRDGAIEACPGLTMEDYQGPNGDAGASGNGANCTGVAFEGSLADMFILMDRTISQSYLVEGTSMSRWEVMTEAVRQFTESPEVLGSGLNAGIVFENAHGTANPDVECNPNDYAIPTVDMGPIGETGPDMVAAMEAIQPAGMTPLVPAVEGAMRIAKAWQEDHPDRTTVLVLVGDGYPTICDEQDPSDIAAIVGEGYESQPSVRTYAIGVGASSELNLDNYARYGGTSEAVMMEYEDAIYAFAEAMLNITNSFIPCDYSIPEPPDDWEVDYGAVQVIYDPFVGDPEEIPVATGAANCGNGGWYYDDERAPERINLCPCSCARLGGGTLTAMFGCPARPAIN